MLLVDKVDYPYEQSIRWIVYVRRYFFCVISVLCRVSRVFDNS